MKKNSAIVITQILIKAAFSDIQKENKNTTLGQVAAILRRVNHITCHSFAGNSGLTVMSVRSTTKLLCVCV